MSMQERWCQASCLGILFHGLGSENWVFSSGRKMHLPSLVPFVCLYDIQFMKIVGDDHFFFFSVTHFSLLAAAWNVLV